MKQYFAIILATIILAGCSKKLDQVPKDTASKDAVFGSEKGLELYSWSFYEMLPDANAIHRGDEMSDYGARTYAPEFLREGGFGPRQSSGWSWSALRNVNYFIQNCTDPRVPENVRQHYIGLARFFRAWFYFDKVKRFGDVPWINKTLDVSDPDLFNSRDSRVLIMDSILADLDFACENIRTTNDNTRSLITRYVAYAFKSRVCLFEGTFRKYHDIPGGLAEGLGASADGWLSKAVDAAAVVMQEGGFSLHQQGGAAKSYRELFTSSTPAGQEVILAAICDKDLNVLNDANWWWTSATYGIRFSFTRTFINTYLNIDGTPFTNTAGYETMPFPDEVKGRDMRLQQTIRMGNYKRINGGAEEPAPPLFSYTYTGYQPIKFCLDDISLDAGRLNENSLPVIRYAEVLLNYAEAKTGLGMLTDEDWAKTIGALRQRAGITGGLNALPVVVDTYLQATYFPEISDPVLLEVRRERAIELALEGFRFYDIVRWHKGELMEKPWTGFYVPALDVPMDLNEDGVDDVFFYQTKPATEEPGITYVNVAPTISVGTNPQQLQNGTYGEITWLHNILRKWEEKHYLYPIPEDDRLMNPDLGQNPGW